VSVREARLKREGAAEYPGMPVERWMPAIELAPFLLQRARVRRQERRYARTFDPKPSIFAEAIQGLGRPSPALEAQTLKRKPRRPHD